MRTSAIYSVQMILLAILAIVFQSSLIHGYNLFGKRIALPSFVKNTLSVVVCSTCLLNLPVYADISDMDIARAYSSASIRLASSDGEDTATSKLTAGQLLQTDVQPRISLLKDIVTSMNQYESLVTAKDYVSIRQALRTEPAVELRKTCRSLEKYLKADQLKNYKNAYSVMISSIDDLDGLALRRIRGDNVPLKDVLDSETLAAVKDSEQKLDTLIKIAEL